MCVCEFKRILVTLPSDFTGELMMHNTIVFEFFNGTVLLLSLELYIIMATFY